MYENGYVFTRLGKGVMQQTRSVRIDLSKFELSSENRRVLKKVSDLKLEPVNLNHTSYDWDWRVGKMAKDFYDTKFGPGIMSAQKVKIMLVDGAQSNFNLFYKYLIDGTEVGFAICYSNNDLTHYSYPFYNLGNPLKDMGLGMMTLAINAAKNSGTKYIYLGSLQRPSDTYKLQFSGLEWFDGKVWQSDIEKVKKILASASI